MLNLLSPVSPRAGILPSFDAHKILGRGKEFLFNNKKGKGKKRERNVSN